MNYSLYPDILPSHTKSHFQKDYFIKEELNNDDVLTKSKVNIIDDISINDNLSEKIIMKRFISAVSKNIKNPNSKDVSLLTEAYPSTEENIIKAASILFFSIGHSSLISNKKSNDDELTEKDLDNMSYDDGSDSDSSCNSETECYCCGYYPIRNGVKRHKSHCDRRNKNSKIYYNNNKHIINRNYESCFENNTLHYMKNDININNKDNNNKECNNYTINDNKMKIEEKFREIEMNNDIKMEDQDQIEKKGRNNKRKRENIVNETSPNNNFNSLNQNEAFINKIYLQNQNTCNLSINNINNNNMYIHNSNELIIPQNVIKNETTINNTTFTHIPFRKIKCKTENINNLTPSLFSNSKIDKLPIKNLNKTKSNDSTNSKSSKQSNKNKQEKITQHDLINGIRFFHLQPSNDPNARKYLCSYPGCTSAFQRKYNCRSHYSSVHLQLRPYHCDCGINFTRKYDLYRHDSMVHRRGPMMKNFNNKNKNSNNGKGNKNNNKANNSLKKNINTNCNNNKDEIIQNNKIISSINSLSINNGNNHISQPNM
ncbi:hypothetical protein H8356DRAFT_1061292 [Neocallimastix lanati (nom. inval.)]|nr:hypothetical protein H8356DRAFT_1061292 [Neocallimastix sp. JGI-2020a]